MTKFYRLLSALLILISLTVFAGEVQFYPFPFVGKWNPTEDPMLLDDYGLQDIQNLRKSGKHFKGVNGHTKINSTAVGDVFILNGFHFRKDSPVETHILIWAANAFNAKAGNIYDLTTAAPGTGNFTAIITPTTYTNFWFSMAPADSVVISNNGYQKIWGGNEYRITAFYESAIDIDYTISNATDHTDVLSKLLGGTDETANVSNYMLIGSTRQLQGINFYVTDGNASTSTLSGWEYRSGSWTSLSLTDGTASGGKSLAQTGNVTWTASTAGTQRYINGLSLYWYKFRLSAGSAVLSYVTCNAPVQRIKNVWDGVEIKASVVKTHDGTDWIDETISVGDEDETTLMEMSGFDAADEFLYIGFTQQVQGVDIKMYKPNEDDGVATVQYWSGTAWANVTALNDGTNSVSNATSNATLNSSGVISFTPATSSAEQPQPLADDVPLYYYKLHFSNLDGECNITEIRGIPATEQVIPRYRLSQMFQNRLFLFNEYGGMKNKAVYSVYNTADIFNGADSGELYFGDNTDISAAVSIYNVFNATGGIEQLIVTKKNETYRLTGYDAKTWSVQRISTNVGCIAPFSMVSADIADLDNTKRQVAIWTSDKGVYMSDGATVRSISDDIACYFNPNDSRYIPLSMQSKSFGWYDPSIKSYKLLIASGANATYLNTELEFSLKYNEWTKVSRPVYLQSGWNVYDEKGVQYTYGGASNGYVYRLENGDNFDGTNITSYLQTKDMILDQQVPLARLSTVKHIRATHSKKATGAITITHYGDGVATTSGTDEQQGPDSIAAANALAYPYDTQSVLLGPFLTHSFKFSAATNVDDGLEMTGFGLWYEPYDAIRQ